MGRDVDDIDIATQLEPEQTLKDLEALIQSRPPDQAFPFIQLAVNLERELAEAAIGVTEINWDNIEKAIQHWQKAYRYCRCGSEQSLSSRRLLARARRPRMAHRPNINCIGRYAHEYAACRRS